MLNKHRAIMSFNKSKEQFMPFIMIILSSSMETKMTFIICIITALLRPVASLIPIQQTLAYKIRLLPGPSDFCALQMIASYPTLILHPTDLKRLEFYSNGSSISTNAAIKKNAESIKIHPDSTASNASFMVIASDHTLTLFETKKATNVYQNFNSVYDATFGNQKNVIYFLVDSTIFKYNGTSKLVTNITMGGQIPKQIVFSSGFLYVYSLLNSQAWISKYDTNLVQVSVTPCSYEGFSRIYVFAVFLNVSVSATHTLRVSEDGRTLIRAFGNTIQRWWADNMTLIFRKSFVTSSSIISTTLCQNYLVLSTNMTIQWINLDTLVVEAQIANNVGHSKACLLKCMPSIASVGLSCLTNNQVYFYSFPAAAPLLQPNITNTTTNTTTSNTTDTTVTTNTTTNSTTNTTKNSTSTNETTTSNQTLQTPPTQDVVYSPQQLFGQLWDRFLGQYHKLMKSAAAANVMNVVTTSGVCRTFLRPFLTFFQDFWLYGFHDCLYPRYLQMFTDDYDLTNLIRIKPTFIKFRLNLPKIVQNRNKQMKQFVRGLNAPDIVYFVRAAQDVYTFNFGICLISFSVIVLLNCLLNKSQNLNVLLKALSDYLRPRATLYSLIFTMMAPNITFLSFYASLQLTHVFCFSFLDKLNVLAAALSLFLVVAFSISFYVLVYSFSDRTESKSMLELSKFSLKGFVMESTINCLRCLVRGVLHSQMLVYSRMALAGLLLLDLLLLVQAVAWRRKFDGWFLFLSVTLYAAFFLVMDVFVLLFRQGLTPHLNFERCFLICVSSLLISTFLKLLTLFIYSTAGIISWIKESCRNETDDTDDKKTRSTIKKETASASNRKGVIKRTKKGKKSKKPGKLNDSFEDQIRRKYFIPNSKKYQYLQPVCPMPHAPYQTPILQEQQMIRTRRRTQKLAEDPAEKMRSIKRKGCLVQSKIGKVEDIDECCSSPDSKITRIFFVNKSRKVKNITHS